MNLCQVIVTVGACGFLSAEYFHFLLGMILPWQSQCSLKDKKVHVLILCQVVSLVLMIFMVKSSGKSGAWLPDQAIVETVLKPEWTIPLEQIMIFFFKKDIVVEHIIKCLGEIYRCGNGMVC